MVHEPFLAFREGSVRQDAAAVIHRLMVSTLLSVVRRVWVAIPAWADLMRPWAFGRGREITFCWRPVPSNIPVVDDTRGADRIRSEYLKGNPGPLIGHFSTYDRNTCGLMEQLAPPILGAVPGAHLLLLGSGSAAFAARLARMGWQDRVSGSNRLSPSELSLNIAACDLFMQPYVDGASTRRTTLMAALAHGRPVVTTFGRLSEPFWRESGAVTVVDAGEPGAFVDAVRRLASDSDRRREQSRVARALYESRFAVEHTIRALVHDLCDDASDGVEAA